MQINMDSKSYQIPNEWNQPIFIIGNPRSGTSLLRIMLHSHSKIVIPPESHFFLWLEDKFQDWENLDLDKFLEALFASTKFETWQLNKEDLKAFIQEQKPQSFAQLNSLIYYFYGIQNGKQATFWGDKNKLWKEKLLTVLKQYPSAKFIHLIRDGRDVACSFKALGNKKMISKYAPKLPTDIESIAKRWDENIKAILAFEKQVKTSNFMIVPYEQLLLNTKDILEKVCDFLGIELENNMVEYYKKKEKDIEPKEFFQWKEKLLSPPDKVNIGKYKQELTTDEIKTFERIAKSPLTQFNYL